MSSRRLPLTVYSVKRRQRSISNPYSRPVPSSSPLKPLAHDVDITMEEMSRRMMKRSRNGLKRTHSGLDPFKSASVGASPIDRPLDDVRPAKRTKGSARAPLQTIVEPSHMPVPVEEQEDATADMDLTDIVQLKTPVPRDDANAEKPADNTTNEESDFLSPLPSSRLAKRVIAHRTSSSNLTENKNKKSNPSSDYMLMSPAASDLASPFHSRPGSPNPNRHHVKNALNKKLNRTRSVGTDLRRRATLRSASRAVSPASNVSSPGARRHPSLPNSQVAQKENQDWFVPAQIKRPARQAISRKPSETSIPFVRESSFFDSVPEACSTPMRPKRDSMIVPPTPERDIDATPRVRLGTCSSAGISLNRSDFTLDEPTPRARPSVSIIASALLEMEDSIFPDSPTIPIEEPARKLPIPLDPPTAQRRQNVHISDDSIFSSALDFPTSALDGPIIEEAPEISDKTRVEQESATLAPPASPVADLSPASSEGDELRDMFSILGLDEDEHWDMNSSARMKKIDSSSSVMSSASTACKAKKKTKSTLSARTGSTKQEVVGAKVRAMRAGARTSASHNQGRRRRVLIAPDASSNEATRIPARKREKAHPTKNVRILDEPIRAESDSSDPIDFLKARAKSSD